MWTGSCGVNGNKNQVYRVDEMKIPKMIKVNERCALIANGAIGRISMRARTDITVYTSIISNIKGRHAH